MVQLLNVSVSSPSVRDKVSPAEWKTRVDLAAAYRLAEHNRWTDMIFNHFTARVPDSPTHFLIKRHSMMFEEVTASNLVKVDLSGPVVGHADDVNYAAFPIHSAVYDGRPHMMAVAHLHSMPGLVISARKEGLRFLCQESMMLYGRVGYHGFEGIAEDIDEAARISRDLGDHRALIMRNHGLLTCGTSIQEAVILLKNLIIAADMQIRIESTGAEISEIPQDVCEKTARQFATQYEADQWQPEWQAMLRWLDRRDPNFRN